MGVSRIQFELPEHKAKHLESLADAAGVTKKDFISNALTLLAWAIRETKNGKVIASVDPRTMKFKEVLLPVLDHTAPIVEQEQEQHEAAAVLEAEQV